MANDVRIVITADDMTKAGRESAERGSRSTSDKIGTDLDGIGTKGEQAGKKIKTGFENGTQGAKDFDRLLGSATKDGETGFQTLSRTIDETKAKLVDLRTDFQTTGSRGIFGDITAAEADLKKLESYLDGMIADIPKKSGAEDSGKKVVGLLEKGVESVPFIGGISIGIGRFLAKFISDAEIVGEEAGGALAIGMGSAAEAGAEDIPQLFTPQGVIGAAILAAIVGGLAVTAGGLLASVMAVAVGGGLIAAGAVILRNNATILASFHRLKTDIGSEFKDAAQPLVGPFSDALDKIDAKFAKMGPQLHDLFSSVAPAVGPILTGLTDFIAYLIPRMAAVGHLFTEMFADPGVQSSLHGLGVAFGAMFTVIGSNKQTAVDFFKLLLDLVTAAILAVDGLILAAQTLDAAFHGLTGNFGFLDVISTKAPAAAQGVGQLTDATGAALPNFQAYIDKLNTVAATVDTTAGTITDKLLGAMMSSDEATLHWQESLTNLSKAFHDNKFNLDITTAAGQANREAILNAVQANIQMYDTMIKNGSSAVDAAKAYDANFSSLEHLHGLTKSQQSAVDGLIGSYKKVPDEVNTDLAVNGLTDAINDLDDLLRALNDLPALKYVTVEEIHRESNVVGGGSAPPPQRSSNPVKHKPVKHATGGILGSEPTTYGEEGWELLRMPGAMVASHADSVSRTAAPGPSTRGGHAATAAVEFVGNVDTVVASMFQKLIRTGQIRLTIKNNAVVAG